MSAHRLAAPSAADRLGLQVNIPQLAFAAACIAAAALLGCSRPPPAAPPAPGPVEVGVVTIEPAAVTLTRELPGRVSAFRVAEVRARVNGIVLKRLFTEGADVKEGQPLFQIDAAPYQAALGSARAQLARAEASLASARLLARRYGELIETERGQPAGARQRPGGAEGAEADVAAGRAAVETASINLGYTTVTAPVSGRIGRSAVTEGAYAQAAQATLLATIQQLDPVYVDLTQSSVELLRLRRALESGQLQRASRGRRAPGWRSCSRTGATTRRPGRCSSPTSPSIRAPAPSRCARSSPTRRASSCPACSCAPASTRA